jgi:predicted RNase H-like HicB family nuclease
MYRLGVVAVGSTTHSRRPPSKGGGVCLVSEPMMYSVTLEHGSDGTYLAWVHELPGCFVRGETRAEVEERLPEAIRSFHEWLRSLGETVDDAFEVEIVSEVESLIEAGEDTEVLLDPDRAPLTADDWRRIERWLSHSRPRLLKILARLGDEQLERRPDGATRSIREELIHIGFVELMYAGWTFDLRSRQGLRFLDWTRQPLRGGCASLPRRMREPSPTPNGQVHRVQNRGPLGRRLVG